MVLNQVSQKFYTLARIDEREQYYNFIEQTIWLSNQRKVGESLF